MYKEYMFIDAVKIAVKYSSDGYKESIHAYSWKLYASVRGRVSGSSLSLD